MTCRSLSREDGVQAFGSNEIRVKCVYIWTYLEVRDSYKFKHLLKDKALNASISDFPDFGEEFFAHRGNTSNAHLSQSRCVGNRSKFVSTLYVFSFDVNPARGFYPQIQYLY